MTELLQHTSFGIGFVGVLIIIHGVLRGLWRFLLSEFAAVRGRSVDAERRHLRLSLGYYLLLGLEFLIAADIIQTLMQPGPNELITLGVVVAIRTVISYSLNFELRHESHAPPSSAP